MPGSARGFGLGPGAWALAGGLLAAAIVPLCQPLPPPVADASAWLGAAEGSRGTAAAAPLRLSYIAGRWELPLVERRLAFALPLWSELPEDLRRELALEVAALADLPPNDGLVQRLRASLPPDARLVFERLLLPGG